MDLVFESVEKKSKSKSLTHSLCRFPLQHRRLYCARFLSNRRIYAVIITSPAQEIAIGIASERNKCPTRCAVFMAKESTLSIKIYIYIYVTRHTHIRIFVRMILESEHSYSIAMMSPSHWTTMFLFLRWFWQEPIPSFYPSSNRPTGEC